MNPLEMNRQPKMTSLNESLRPSPKLPPTSAPVALSKRNLAKIPDAEAAILAKLDFLLTAMFDLALGHYQAISKYDKETGNVETRVYEVPPDYKALAFLIENVIGKVPQRVEMTGEGGGPMRVVPWMSQAEAIRMGLAKVEDADEAAEEPPTDAEYHEIPAVEASDGEPS